MLPLDSPSNLTQELGQLIGVTVDKQDISIAHRLPDTKSKKDRFIVKFVRREKRDEFTSHTSTSLGKKEACFHPWLVRSGKAAMCITGSPGSKYRKIPEISPSMCTPLQI